MMTEADWLACDDPQTMLECLKGKMSERKCRLFAVACCRRIWRLLTDERSRKAVQVAEKYADGLATSGELAEFRESARALVHQMGVVNVFAAISAYESSNPALIRPFPISGKTLVQEIAHWVVVAVKRQYHIKEAGVVGWSRQAEFLRCIFGNPFHHVTISAAVLAWNDGVILRLAQGGYGERQLPTGTLDDVRLAVLSDALEEAGAPAELAAHLRLPGPHVRGCWAVDLCLGLS